MSQYFRHIIAYSAWALSSTVIVADELPAIEMLRAVLVEHSSACASLKFSYRQEAGPIRFVQDGESRISGGRPPVVYEWLSSGAKARLTHPLQPATSVAPETSPFFVSFDGQRGYSVVYWSLHAEIPSQVNCQNSPPPGLRGCHPLMALGWQLPVAEQTLVKCLELPGAVVVHREMVDGLDCVQIDVPGVTVNGQNGHFLRCWLAPSFGWLPRRWLLLPLRFQNEVPTKGSNETLEPGESAYVADVLDYHMVGDLLTERQYRFPSETRLNGAICAIEKTDVHWNIRSAVDDFQPTIQAGIQWKEYQGVKLVKSYVTGGALGKKMHEEYLKEIQTPEISQVQHASISSSPPQLAVAKPVDYWGVWGILAMLGCVLLIAGLWRWRRS